MNPDELFDEERYRPTPADALPAADLTELLAQAAGSRAYEPELFRRLLTDSLVILAQDWPQPEPGSQEPIPLKPLFLQSGELPVFTGLAPLFANPDLDPTATPYAFVNGRELLTGMQQHTLLLDAFSVMNMLLPPEFIGQQLAGNYPRQVVADQVDALEGGQEVPDLSAVPPAQQPLAEQLGQELALLFRQHPRVRRAYLVWQEQVEDLAEPCFVVFADIEGANERLGQEIAYVASKLLNDARLNLRMYFNADPEFLQALAAHLELTPFYQD